MDDKSAKTAFTEDVDSIKDTGILFSVLVSVMEKLRSGSGCIWDREQTHESIKKNLIEEAYEALESIEDGNYGELREELGDILLQVVFHSRIAEDNKEFDINDVIRAIIRKLIRRHPHVFGDKQVQSSKDILQNWESIKKSERKEKNSASLSLFSNIPRILPALHYACEIQNRAARLGFDWDSIEGVVEKVNEEIKELSAAMNLKNESIKLMHEVNKNTESNDAGISEELGDLLFSVVNLSRHLGLDSEQCLRQTCRKFMGRFDCMEEYADKKGIDFKSLPLNEKDLLWEMAKNDTRKEKL
jgi:tetrapyrrole methylase family protein / MazG family protein